MNSTYSDFSRIVSAVLGHASPSFTIAVYQHAWQEGPSEAAAALEAALGTLCAFRRDA